jgi:hypothetical protein
MTDLIDDDISRAFSTHPRLSARAVALLKVWLKDRLQKILEQGDVATASVLTRLAANDEAAGAAYELNRGDRRVPGNYKRPTVDALLWRDLESRRLLGADKVQAYKCAARHESRWRACIFIELLSELAKMTTQFPAERAVAEGAARARAAVKEWETAEKLRALGFPDDAARHMQLADLHLSSARIFAREYAQGYRDEMLRMTFWRLARHFGFKGNRMAAALVSAALKLDVPISHSHTRYVAKSFYDEKK